MMRVEFYPTIAKQNLFSESYIAYHSGHSRGSTMDLTIVPLGSAISRYNPQRKQVSCPRPILIFRSQAKPRII